MDSEEYIYGRNAVMELLAHRPEQITKLYLRQNLSGRPVAELERRASAARIPVQRVPGRRLAEMVGSVNDQGVVAQISAGRYLELEDWLDQIDMADRPVLLALDEIEDPGNFGAMIRSALACGVDGVLVAKHRQAPLSGGVMKSSAGTVLRMPVIRVVNLNQSLLLLKDKGFWIYGTDMKGTSDYRKQRYDAPMVLVAGNEERGLRKKTRDHCDVLLRIPMLNGVESLNVSVSTALICYEILRNRQVEPE